MIITDFLGDRLYSVALNEDEYALFSELEEQREFAINSEVLRNVISPGEKHMTQLIGATRKSTGNSATSKAMLEGQKKMAEYLRRMGY